MKIASFNVNNVRKRLPNLIAWLEAARPDVVCLQELKTAHGDFPATALAQAGYGAAWRGEKTWNGVAILARGAEPIVTRSELPGDADDRQSRYIEAAVNGVIVGCLYAPNGNPQPGPKFTYKLAWMARLARHARGLFRSGAPVALAGDFNVVPTDFDIYPTTSYDDDALLQPRSRAALTKILDQGWTDAVRALHPDAPMYTFWDYMRNRWPRDAGLRIDFILLNAELAARLKAAGVDRAVRGAPNASDHAPVWAVVDDAPPSKRRRPAARTRRASRSPARGRS
jgi:exodeoxyribonuclease-3